MQEADSNARRTMRGHRFGRRLIACAAVALAALAAGSCSSSSSSGPRPQYLFSVETEGAHIVIDESTGAERQVLVMPIEEVVTWFTDRPVRQAGDMTMQQFIDDWTGNGFADDAPDASLIVTTPDGEERTHVVELLNVAITDSGVYFELHDLIDANDHEAAGDVATHAVETGVMEFVELFIESTSSCARCQRQVNA